jgi:hypothetical protein
VVLHDGALTHFKLCVRQWLGRHYLVRGIGRGREAPVSWLPRSSDINPIHIYLCGSMRNAVCANSVDSREQLWQRVQDAANEIRTTPGCWNASEHMFMPMEDISSSICDKKSFLKSSFPHFTVVRTLCP